MKRPPVFLWNGGSCLSTIVLTISLRALEPWSPNPLWDPKWYILQSSHPLFHTLYPLFSYTYIPPQLPSNGKLYSTLIFYLPVFTTGLYTVSRNFPSPATFRSVVSFTDLYFADASVSLHSPSVSDLHAVIQ